MSKEQSERMKKKWADPEYRIKMVEAQTIKVRRGHKISDTHKEAIRRANKGRIKSPETRGKMRQARRSRDDYRGCTTTGRLERDRVTKLLIPKVLERDGYTCQICFNPPGGNLHVDHIQSWASAPELREDMDNLRTLCRPCHYYVTFKKVMPSGSKWGLYWKYSRTEKVR